ncbi:hypothetical protein PYCCODRAFT_1224602 [Trametes coccinea BRFM310]|uniref:Uncharacterized protein n=1 Tax=Trametes coccinea (strain BRFM310) TaxID=1353009 RepID=A0A1Y2IW00_TRAC3|nr:hypothetical protein PYCCODRAFT_1224602 [Trametes coccinea BRFM310]
MTARSGFGKHGNASGQPASQPRPPELLRITICSGPGFFGRGALARRRAADTRRSRNHGLDTMALAGTYRVRGRWRLSSQARSSSLEPLSELSDCESLRPPLSWCFHATPPPSSVQEDPTKLASSEARGRGRASAHCGPPHTLGLLLLHRSRDVPPRRSTERNRKCASLPRRSEQEVSEAPYARKSSPVQSHTVQ